MAKRGRKKGTPKTGGRKKGTPNKLTTEVKSAILAAFDKVGGVDYLENVAKTDPRTFCTLLGKIIPTQIDGELNVNLTHEQALEALMNAAERVSVSHANGHA